MNPRPAPFSALHLVLPWMLQEDMSFDEKVHSTAEASSSPSSHHVQTSPISTLQQPPLLCPVCKRSCRRRQELKRHLLSFHLPLWIYCPHSRCLWRGHRSEDLKTHLAQQKCGPIPKRKQYEIYDKDLVVGWILDGTSVEVAARFALGFVEERARELLMTEEWEDLWGH
ncbi:hypothetical protein BJV78DRAFT_1212122 [Lactifluus subvellereus]|nr:hypothetical protein BJV78DRAFT_1212122 [Lactifluus subvellereus]